MNGRPLILQMTLIQFNFGKRYSQKYKTKYVRSKILADQIL